MGKGVFSSVTFACVSICREFRLLKRCTSTYIQVYKPGAGSGSVYIYVLQLGTYLYVCNCSKNAGSPIIIISSKIVTHLAQDTAWGGRLGHHVRHRIADTVAAPTGTPNQLQAPLACPSSSCHGQMPQDQPGIAWFRKGPAGGLAEYVGELS